MTSKKVTTDQNLLDIDSCNLFGYDCSPTHDWITINATRNDHNSIFILHKALSKLTLKIVGQIVLCVIQVKLGMFSRIKSV